MSKGSFILPGILTVGDAIILPQEILNFLTRVMSRNVSSFIENFLDYYVPGGDDEDQTAAEKIRIVYDIYKEELDYMNSDRLGKIREDLAHLNLQDINYQTPVDRLYEYQSMYKEILDNSYMVHKFDRDNLENTVQMMREACIDYDDEVTQTVNKVTSNMLRMAQLFYNKDGEKVQVSKLSSILARQDTLEKALNIISDVLDLRSQSGDGIDPSEWRCF